MRMRIGNGNGCKKEQQQKEARRRSRWQAGGNREIVCDGCYMRGTVVGRKMMSRNNNKSNNNKSNCNPKREERPPSLFLSLLTVCDCYIKKQKVQYEEAEIEEDEVAATELMSCNE